MTVMAAFSEVSGTLTCEDCLECGPVTGQIGQSKLFLICLPFLELWEADNLSSDDFQDKKPILDGKYEGLALNEFEWFPTTPYFIIKHSCSPFFWRNGKRLPHKIHCHVETIYRFEEPSNKSIKIDINLRRDGKSEIVCV
jgi:hypothetical protein